MACSGLMSFFPCSQGAQPGMCRHHGNSYPLKLGAIRRLSDRCRQADGSF